MGQWQWGVPNFNLGPDAHSGQRCWGTNLNGHYSAQQDHVLTTPYFDLTGMIDPRLALWHWYSIWGPYDGINVEIMIEGQNWQVLHPVGGYPDSCIDGLPGAGCEPGWTASSHLGLHRLAGLVHRRPAGPRRRRIVPGRFRRRRGC